MDSEAGDTLDDELDIKPIIAPNPSHMTNGLALTPSLPTVEKKWLPGSWQDANRKSAFQPYKQATLCTVLTNLQRGNTQAETPVPQVSDINFHTKAGQGEITESDVNNENDIDLADERGLSALHWAAAYGQINSVQILLNHGAELDKMGPDGETSLILAANGGHHDVVRLLLEKGAAVNHMDDLGNTPLMYAACGNHPHSCNELLLHGADVTMVNTCHETAYTMACDNEAHLSQAVIENYLATLMGSL